MDSKDIKVLVEELLPLDKEETITKDRIPDLMYILDNHHDIDIRFRAHLLIALKADEDYKRPILERMVDIYPHRAEAAWELAMVASDKDPQLEFEMAKRASSVPFPTGKPYISKDIYDWKALDKVCITGYYTENHEDSYSAHLKLKERSHLIPSHYRERCISNGMFSKRILDLRESTDMFKKTVVKMPSMYIGDTDIPNIYHMIWFKGSRPFGMIHYCASKLIHEIQNPSIIYVYNDIEPEDNIWWEKLKKIDTVRVINCTPPQYINNTKLKYIQHVADVARLLVLEKGGVYFDSDLLIKKPIHTLLQKGKLHMVKCDTFLMWNGFIATPPKNPMIIEWISTYHKKYGKSMFHDWGGLSLHVPFALSLEYNKYFVALDANTLLPFNWDHDPLFTSSETFPDSYGMHLWESVAEKRENLPKDTDWIKNNKDKGFSILFEKYLED